MQKTINGIVYRPRAESNARLITKGIEGQTPLAESQASIDARSYQLSERNGANAYIIPIEKEKVYLNFVAQKVFVEDRDIREILNPQFEYFVDDVIEDIPTFELEDGIIFRCVTGASTPQSKENYTYYIMQDGVAKQIPNYKTLEVMLAERNQNLLSVRVLEKSQCDQIPREADDDQIPSKASSWTQDMEDQTSLEKLKALELASSAAGAIVAQASAASAAQIAVVQAQAAAANNAAAASAAQAAASQAASAAAIAQAQAAQAAADAAKAEAEAAKAIAESGQG